MIEREKSDKTRGSGQDASDADSLERLVLLRLGRLELGQLLENLDLGLSLGRSVGVVSPSVDVRLQMSSVGELGVVLLLLRARSLRLGRVELGEVSLVAVGGEGHSSAVSVCKTTPDRLRWRDVLVETLRVLPDDAVVGGGKTASVTKVTTVRGTG